MKKVVIAMSGGLDSSVAAALLKKGGKPISASFESGRFDVMGVFMKLYPGSLRGSEKSARKVAQILNIPFYVLDFEKEFKKRVVDYFLREYEKGRTPNPCIVCNKEIKFGVLLEKALALGADFVATGHYARKREIKNKNLKIKNYELLRAKDKGKDQSYFLWQLNQKQLKHILFPIGDYTKKEVGDLAKKFKLPVLDVPESQEICFIQTTLEEFLARYLEPKPGKIVDLKGKVIGEHQGLWFYTIGQRKGLGIAGGPWYVVEKEVKNNILIVSRNEKDLKKKELIAEKVNWISGSEPKLPLTIKAKIRYRHRASSATIYHLKPNICHLKFVKPQRAITPGQSVVFYKREQLLGGGIIQ
ncbi:tRNA 2-thiouridine(34) synthase MnmA [bacterium]|nr:tRNA 2-thiouridine(34) synthase MnmA [bacterium]